LIGLDMQDGEVVEQADARTIMESPREDYTRRLMGAVPRGWQAEVAPA